MSSQKKKTPAEELVDSLLDEVENGSDSLPAFSLSEEENDSLSGTLAAAGEGTSAGVDDDQQISGLVNMDPTVVAGSMTFGSLLRNKKNDKTDIKTSMASQSEMRTEVQASSHEATQIQKFELKDLQIPEATSVMGQDFSSEEASAYEATRIGKAPTGDEEASQNTEFGELQLEPMSDNVVNLQSLDLSPPQAHEPTEMLSLTEPESPALTSILETPAVPEGIPSLFSSPPEAPMLSLADENVKTQVITSDMSSQQGLSLQVSPDSQVGTIAADPLALHLNLDEPKSVATKARGNDGDGTVAVNGFQVKPEENLEGKVKVSVGKQGRSSGFASWGGDVDNNLSQAENLRMAQEKILELEKENERLRRQNEELVAASEILKERSDMMTSQLTEYKNDREGLEQSFKNEMTLLKNHVGRKDAELKRAQIKVEELESRLKFDLKKIRVRERELENRLELVRAEKNAISKNKDEQILDLRRKMDIIQMEVDSYRQKCIELNKQIESSQDSFKRTTRALRLAMANLELQEENKGQLKKAE